MLNHKIQMLVLVKIISGLILLLTTSAGAEESFNMGGWGLNDPYNKHYDVKEFEKIRAWVKRIKTIVPMPGMPPGVALGVHDGGAGFEVHIAPVWFLKPHEIGIKPGDRIKIKGVWAEIKDEDVFIASKIKKGNFWELKVRLTKNGKPFWTMSPDELAKERAQK